MQQPYEFQASDTEARHVLAPIAAARYEQVKTAAEAAQNSLSSTLIQPIVKSVVTAEAVVPQPVAAPADVDPTLAALSAQAASLAVSAADTIVER